MKARIPAPAPTPEQRERQAKQNIKNNRQYLNYASRVLMLSVRQNAGFGVSRLKLFNDGTYDLGQEYIRRYSPEDYDMSDKDYAVDSYWAMRRDLCDIGWDPTAELWRDEPFTAADMHLPGYLTVRERREVEDWLYYANAISFYVREMYCMAALELHGTAGFGAGRLSRVLHPCRDRWMELMRIYLSRDRLAVERQMKLVLKEFNGCGIFAEEVIL